MGNIMKTYTDFKLGNTFTFNCQCGSTDFERTKSMRKHKDFYTGHFICSNCKKYHDYTSEAFEKHKTQMSLF